ncbi:DNA circularization protein [Chromohalobacter israelensis]|uniref:DNA circularization protein n=1 Tax=Chromohalobacter israelensis TaxID=141390 RepID=UPI000FFE6B9B|nr:DNA circularization N-terminal domain-containing protein [Chromohalobacter salexigens]RXE49219.1 hypothetical protein B4O83_15080 [Chromohalobacter salexigens]
MSWHDRVGDGTAVFRGITLYLERGSISPGRRTEVHEYPLRDDPYVEDLGRATRPWQITGYLIGEDYDIERNRLADALELPGAFEMRHSYYGTHRVVVIGEPRITETTREGGMARVSMNVLRADDAPRYPTAVTDTQTRVADAASESRLAILDDFIAAYDVVQLAANRVAAVETAILDAIDSVTGFIGDITNTIARVIRTPAELGAAIMSAIGEVGDMLGEPGRALGVYEALFDAGETPRVGYEVSFSAPEDARLAAEAQTAAVTLIRRTAAIEAARVASEGSYTASQDAVEAVEIVHRGITEQLAGSVPPLPQTARRLVTLRAAVVEDLRQRSAALPELRQYTLNARMPALVIAQRLYGDALRADDIVSRNRVRHPSWVPADDPLEVLSE